jgi:MurNAc alpha-1-phosphate uridylyltransferase
MTDSLPKPLIEVGGTTLIERHLCRLRDAGIQDIVINVSHLGALIEARLGDGRAYDVRIAYSREPDGPLETGGGIARALPLLGDAPFLVVNADVWTDCPLDLQRYSADLAHLVLVPNPPHHPAGDFDLQGDRVTRAEPHPYTYAGIGVYAPRLFAGRERRHFPLAPLLFELSAAGQLSGEIHHGRWFDIGTLERLEHARAAVAGG